MEFLLEINVEEMPSAHVKVALHDLKENLTRELIAAKISVNELRTCGTCRRLVVFADLAEGRESCEKTVTGPPKAVAFAEDGTLTPAALGFAKSKGVDPSRLEIIKTEKGEYAGFRTVEKEKSAAEVLVKAVPQAVGALSFPKMMRWNESQIRFSRPIRNILCLLDGKLLSLEIAGLASKDATTGHKIRSPEEIRPKSFTEYQKALKDNFVTLDADERKRDILAQVDSLLAPLKAQLYPDPELLDKWTNDVECPHVFMGSFPEPYLGLPLEILSTAMREGQKLFSVVKMKKQIPSFLGVADTPADARGFIQKGNERVLKARLEDARFFWEQDLKVGLKKRAPALKHVLFQEKLGSYDDKVQRLKKIVVYLCGKMEESGNGKDVILAAELCKTDLVTDMVREFPSLQGRVGGLYAKAEGLPASVSQAIYEHYQPVGLDDESPSSLGGAILSLADKLDSIAGVAGVGIQTTGSSDPFGLRRNAQGVCKIILDRKMNFSFLRLLDKVLGVYGDVLKRPKKEVLDYCRDFFISRLRYIYERKRYRYDLINAALGPGIDNIYYSFLRVKALDALKSSPQFEPFILMVKRINNILTGQPACSLNADAFIEKQERDLFSTFSIVKENVLPMIAKGDFSQAQKMIFRLQPGLNEFFDHVLVMAKENKLRKNRLALLQAIAKILTLMADYSQVVVEGERSASKK